MSTSYQDISTRLAVVEDKLAFIMSIPSVRMQEPSLLDPTRSIVRMVSLEDLYRTVKTQSGLIVPLGDIPPTGEEKEDV